PGDVFLLCSDGLTGVVAPDEVGAVAQALPPDEAAANVAYLKQMLARKDAPRISARGKPPVVAQDLSD
ncbi:hypothetical protein LTR94_037414, partial [Friedmanniomyces endolithicus]